MDVYIKVDLWVWVGGSKLVHHFVELDEAFLLVVHLSQLDVRS